MPIDHWLARYARGVVTDLVRGDVFYWGKLMGAALITSVPVAILYTPVPRPLHRRYHRRRGQIAGCRSNSGRRKLRALHRDRYVFAAIGPCHGPLND
jgi:hypothetical protein